MPRSRLVIYSLILLVFVITLACRQAVRPITIPTVEISKNTPLASPTAFPAAPTAPQSISVSPTMATFIPTIRNEADITIATPTPDVPRELPEIRAESDSYVVQP